MYETNFHDQVAYVIDKKHKFYLFVSTPENEDTLRFVIINELTQMTRVQSKEFSDNFLALLNFSVKLVVYFSINYTTKLANYCENWFLNLLCIKFMYFFMRHKFEIIEWTLLTIDSKKISDIMLCLDTWLSCTLVVHETNIIYSVGHIFHLSTSIVCDM